MRNLYRETFDELHASEALRQEVLNMTKQEQAAVKRQIPRMLLIAAVIILVLAGTALAATIPGIQEWFTRQWTQETGKAVEKDQMGIITKLTDEIGVSAESGGIEMAVDSVTRGEGTMWILLEIAGTPPEEEMEAQLGQYALPLDPNMLPEGWEPSKKREYDLSMYLEATPAMESELQSWGMLQETRREDGTVAILLQYEAPVIPDVTMLDVEQVTLHLSSLTWGPRLGGRFPIAEGPWELTFSLPVIESQACLTAGSCRLPAYLFTPDGWDSSTMGPPPSEVVEFQDIQVTATGCTLFWTDSGQAGRTHLEPSWSLVMKDGTELDLDTGGLLYDKLPDGTAVTRKSWPVPVDLRQAESLKYRYMGDEYLLPLQRSGS